MNALALAIKRMLEPIKRRVFLTVGQGVVNTVDDSKAIQELQVSLLKGEVRDRVPRYQEYGFSSHPFAKSQCIPVFVAGNRSQGKVVALDDGQFRPTGLAEGEVVLYSDEKSRVLLKRGNEILIESQSGQSGSASVSVKDGQIVAQSSGAANAAKLTLIDGEARLEAPKVALDDGAGGSIELDAGAVTIAGNTVEVQVP